MSTTTVFRFGGTCQSELGCRPVEKVFNMRKHRVRISGKRITMWRISAAGGYAWTGIDSIQEERPGDGKKEAREVSPSTEYLDNELSESLYSGGEPVRQIVLLTDGTDDRPYRLRWPSPSVIFAVSPRHTHDEMLREMTVSGLKIPKSCLVQHVSEDFAADQNEDEDWGRKLLRVGYRGDKPSIWLLQMWNDVCNGYFEKILPVASSLLMKDSLFIGAVPAFTSSEVETRELVRKLLASHGFLAEFTAHGKLDPQRFLEMERSREQTVDMTHDSPLFLTFSARQLRLSDLQVQYARMQIMMAEEEGDEEGFMDAW